MSRYILLDSYKYERSLTRNIVHLNLLHRGKWAKLSTTKNIEINNIRTLSSSLKKDNDDKSTSNNDENYKSNSRTVNPSVELNRKENEPIDNVVSSTSSSLMQSLPVSVQPYAQLARLDKVWIYIIEKSFLLKVQYTVENIC